MAKYRVLIDETGTISSDDVDQQYGFGFCVFESNAGLAQLETRLRTAFPDSLHLKEIRKQRKVRKSAKLMALLDEPHQVLGGAFIFSEPRSCRDKKYELLAHPEKLVEKLGQEHFDAFDGVLKETIDLFPLRSDGLLHPEDMLDGVMAMRFAEVYVNAAVIPIISLNEHFEDIDIEEVVVSVAQVAEKRSFFERIGGTADTIEAGVTELYQNFVLKGITNPPKTRQHVRFEFTDSSVATPLFWYADLFAGVGDHYFRYTEDNSHSLGEELYAVVRDVFSVLPRVANQRILEKGIYISDG